MTLLSSEEFCARANAVPVAATATSCGSLDPSGESVSNADGKSSADKSASEFELGVGEGEVTAATVSVSDGLLVCVGDIWVENPDETVAVRVGVAGRAFVLVGALVLIGGSVGVIVAVGVEDGIVFG